MAGVSAGVDPKRTAAAWINFDGTGTVAIRDSLNVDSLVDNGAGDYVVNWGPFAVADYAVVFGGQRTLTENAAGIIGLETDATGQTTGSVHVKTSNDGGSARDFPIVCLAAYGKLG